MTLILVTANRDRVMQLSDRRLTKVERNCRANTTARTITSEEAPKAWVAHFADARVAIGFAGLASINGGFHVADWIERSLLEDCKQDHALIGTLGRFAARATREFQMQPIASVRQGDRRLSVIFSGYRREANAVRAEIWRVSNFEGEQMDAKPTSAAKATFAVAAIGVDLSARENPVAIATAGWDRALSGSEAQELVAFLRRRAPVAAVIGKGIEIFRAVAADPRSYGAIGSNITSIVVPSDLDEAPSQGFSSASPRSKFEAFRLLDLRGEGEPMAMALTVGRADSEPILVQRVGRNDPCPCGSGKKFKRCHRPTTI